MKMITRELLEQINRPDRLKVLPENGVTLLEFLDSKEFCYDTKILVTEKILPTGALRWIQARMIERTNQAADKFSDKINLWSASIDAIVACVYSKIDIRIEKKQQLDDIRFAASAVDD